MGRTTEINFFLGFLVFTLTISGFCLTVYAQSENPSYRTIKLPSEVDVDAIGPCAGKTAPATCPATCFRTDPVCGINGVTYWCGCAEALCSGTKVAKLGFCDVGNSGSAPLSGQALLLVHILWLIALGISILFGLF